MAIAYGNMKIDGCQRRQPTHDKEFLCRSALLGDVATLVVVAQSKGLHGQYVLRVLSRTLYEECPKDHGHKGDPGVTPKTCGAVGERCEPLERSTTLRNHFLVRMLALK